MAERNKITQAIILTTKNQGENNKIVTYLSPETGISSAILYGGPKSKLKSLVQPFNTGLLYIYEDEVKKSAKITDFDVKNFHDSFHTNLYKMWASNLASEIVLKTKCSGDYETAFKFLTAYIDGIDICEESEARLGTIRFLWRYLCFLGLQPDIFSCQNCSSPLNSENGPFVYLHSINGLLCQDCIPTSKDEINYSQNFHLSMESIHYLQAMLLLTPGKVRNISISAQAVYELKQFLFYLMENAVGSKLKSLESGLGIL